MRCPSPSPLFPPLSPPRSPLDLAFPRASGAARETAIALAGIDEPRMPIYCARQPLWSRGTSGWSQPPSARGQRSAAASAREAGARAASALPRCAQAGFPDVNRLALLEHSRSAPHVTEHALSAQGQHCDLGKQKLCFGFKQLISVGPGRGGLATQLLPLCLLVPVSGNLGANFIIYSRIGNKMLFLFTTLRACVNLCAEGWTCLFSCGPQALWPGPPLRWLPRGAPGSLGRGWPWFGVHPGLPELWDPIVRM